MADQGVRQMHLRVAIAMPTCNRPNALARALDSLRDLSPPQNAEICVIVVDNGDPDSGAEAVCAAVAKTAPWPLHLARQAERGISQARNMLLETALELECDVMLGLDDDEVADPDWGVRMLAGLREQRVELVGGPMDVMADPELTLTRRQARFLEILREEAAVTRQTQIERATRSNPTRHVYAGNFALDLDFIRRTGLRYDVALSTTGGEDSDFAARVLAHGGRTGWVRDAVLTEVLPAARLSARYVFQRNRDFAPNWGRFQRASRIGHALNAAEEAVDLAWLAVPAAFGNRRLRFRALQKSGRFWGHVLAMVGRHTGHYEVGKHSLRR